MGSCFFIGHRETPDRVYPTLLETIERHITEYGVSEFVVGQYGNFDRLVIRALSQAKRAHPDITLMLMTPYYPVNRNVDLPEAFDALFYPPDLETVPKRLAIVRANRYMVERSDFLIAYVRHPASNARELLEYHDAITPEIQRAALAAEVFWPCEIYYHAPADVRDGLIHALLSAEYSSAASNLMSCLAMQGDDKAMETLLELERNPRPWRKGLYVDPSSYAQIGGWTFDKEGQKIQLNFDTCYPMVKGTTGEKSPVRIGRAREDTCPHCGGRMMDMLVLDGRDERLRFLGLDGVLTATCCPSCVGFLKGPAFNRFTLDGGVEVFPSELFDGAEKTDCYVSPEDYKALTENPFVLGKMPVPLFYGAACQDVNTIGGFANWVQDAEYTICPHCGKPMKYLAQIQWDTVFDCAEGTLYVEFCPDCQIVSMQHQQT